MLPKHALPPLLCFMALMLAACLHGLSASGHFPREHRTTALAAGGGAALLFGSIALVIAGVAAGLIVAALSIPWYAAVIGGGLSVLAAPLVLQRFPDRFVDGPGALTVFTATVVAFSLLLIWIAFADPIGP